MPNTSRKYRKKALHPKRVEITDADGWTHVANTQTLSKPNVRKTIRTADGAADDPDEIFDPRNGPVLLPAEVPSRLNHADLRKQFDAHLATWQASVAWQHLRSALLNDVLTKSKDLEDIDNVVCIGLGSPSGFVQGGWVDRRSVALYQLAALVSIIDILHKGHLSSFWP